jgi:prepilin-type N-terminal cleavage/methylation domain-containing protein
MAAGEMTTSRRGFTLLEVMIVVAVIAILSALASQAVIASQKVSRVSAQARLLVQRLQTSRANAVGHGNAQGYYIGPNGLNIVAPDAHQSFAFVKTNPLTPNPVYDPVNDQVDNFRDWLPTSNTSSTVMVQGANGAQAAPISIGFDIDGLPTVNPAGAFPYCFKIRDTVEPSIDRRVILFADGTVKVQNNETYCP